MKLKAFILGVSLLTISTGVQAQVAYGTDSTQKNLTQCTQVNADLAVIYSTECIDQTNNCITGQGICPRPQQPITVECETARNLLLQLLHCTHEAIEQLQ